MTLKILEELRAFHVDRNWYEAHWLQPTQKSVGQRTAGAFARTLVWIGQWPAAILKVRQLVRALPQEWPRPVQGDDVAHARQLLGISEVDSKASSIAASATLQGTSGPIRTARKHVYDVIQQCRHALEKSRERARLRVCLHSLGDRELRDIGIHRSEIDYIVSTDRRPDQSASDDSGADRPVQSDPTIQHEVAA